MSRVLKPFASWVLLLFSIILPFIIIRVFPTFYHHYDLSVFHDWAKAWEIDWHRIYINCESCNYPLLGTYFSGGLISSIDLKNIDHIVVRFRYYLALIDALNVLALWFILRRLQIKYSMFWAGMIGLLPSSWIGSSVWGQIDGFGQFFILLFLMLLILFNTARHGKITYYLFLIMSGILLSLMLLTKQLIYFSVFGLAVILLLNIILYTKSFWSTVFSLLIVFASMVTPILFVDSSLQVGTPYISHLQYILATGSQHGDTVSSLGLNIWSLFSSDILGSSHVPLRIGNVLFPVSLYSMGLLIFTLLNLMILFLFLRDLRREYDPDARTFNIQQLLSALMYFAMVNMVFNIALTGTHERYLFYFFPFILTALLGWERRCELIVLFISACLYGIYLYGYLGGLIHRESQFVVQMATFAYLLLFLYILVFWIRRSKFSIFFSAST